MSGMKNHFDNYMDMILSGGESNDDDSSSVLDDFDDVEEDEKLNVCREIFSAKYDLEDDEASNDSWRDIKHQANGTVIYLLKNIKSGNL